MILPYVSQLSAQKRIILASGSPRRRELLGGMGIKFEVMVSSFDETLPKHEFARAADYAVATARAKALDVAAMCARARAEAVASSSSSAAAAHDVDLIISADTVVEGPGGEILEKPDDGAHAARMLASLSGATHSVHTGVVLLLPRVPGGDDAEGGGAAGQQQHQHASPSSSNYYARSFACTTRVTFDDLPADLIDAYVATGECDGKAGAYGIQGAAGAFVTGIEGCFYSVVGFPVNAFSRELLRLVRDGRLPLHEGGGGK